MNKESNNIDILNNSTPYTIEGNIIDPINRVTYGAVITIKDGKIVSIDKNDKVYSRWIAPGLIDSHVHIESSMLTPQNFGNLVVKHGTVAIVTDPHEIGNVLGVQGIEFMVENSAKSPIKSFFTIPSCVPAIAMAESGAKIMADDIAKMLEKGSYIGLSEVMDTPGVLNKDEDMMKKLDLFIKRGLPIDGHAPNLLGEDLKKYITSGISSDHECSNIYEALEKISYGMKVLIREGSAARNFENLKELIRLHPEAVMFCTDDSHPDEIIELGHIDKIVRRALEDGYDIYDIFRIASLNPIEHYNLNVGKLQVGDSADFIVLDDINLFHINEVFINGEKKYDSELPEEEIVTEPLYFNKFNLNTIDISSLKKKITPHTPILTVEDGELITSTSYFTQVEEVENFEGDTHSDVLKMVYINRYSNGIPQVAFCKGFNLKKGAFASSISHDSHNIIAVGCNDVDLVNAINILIEQQGGLVVCAGQEVQNLPMPIAGIMTYLNAEEVAKEYKALNDKLKKWGCSLESPFMTLSFMSLIVIPEIKIGEKGLFDYSKFDWIKEE